MNWTLVILSLLVFLDTTFCAKRVHRAKRNPNKSTELTNVQGRRGLAEMVAALLPNTYYSRPRFRYPYYGKDGKGELLYGYGGQDLYQYSIFKPLEGYFRK